MMKITKSLSNNSGQIEIIMALVMGFLILLGIVTSQRTAKEEREKTLLEESKIYDLHYRNSTDNELIAEYYRIDLELQTQLDRLARYERSAPTNQPQEYRRGWMGVQAVGNIGYALGRAIRINPIRDKIKKLRTKMSIILTIIHQRGLTLPVSIK